VLCSTWVLKSGVEEKRNAAFEWIKEKYGRMLDWSLRNRGTVVWASVILFGGCHPR